MSKCPLCGTETRPVWRTDWSYTEDYQPFLKADGHLDYNTADLTPETRESYQNAFAENQGYICPSCGESLEKEQVIAMLKEQSNV